MTDNAQTWHQDRPIYRQLMEQVIARILDNTYREGEMLPSVRQLASDFVVNPLTAARYDVLSIPTAILFEGGEARETVVGARSRSHYEDAWSDWLSPR